MNQELHQHRGRPPLYPPCKVHANARFVPTICKTHANRKSHANCKKDANRKSHANHNPCTPDPESVQKGDTRVVCGAGRVSYTFTLMRGAAEHLTSF